MTCNLMDWYAGGQLYISMHIWMLVLKYSDTCKVLQMAWSNMQTSMMPVLLVIHA